MKSLILFFSLIFLFSCGDSANNDANNGGNNGANNGDNNGGGTISDFDCSTFFEKGDDYSTACFPDNMLPEFKKTILSEDVCIYEIGKQEQNDDDLVSVNISKHNPDNIKMIFANFRLLSNGTVVEVPGVGEDAFRDDTQNKVLHVRYKDIALAFTVPDNNPPSCISTNDELEKFAKLVVSNLD